MLLSSSAYFIFLVGIFFLYWPLARMRALSLAVILFANYFFYAKWDLFYLALIPIASTIDYAIGLALGRVSNSAGRRALVTGSIAVNLGILTAFKYMPFLLENFAKLSGREPIAWHWTFPLGISFYVFQSLTYTIDVYRRDAQPTKSLLAYLSAVSFFPTTLAGPITRVSALLPQLEAKDKTLTHQQSGQALFLIAMGLMKKLLVADYLGENLVNRVFDFPKLYTGFETLVGVYAYAFQIYYDFSGYTDIAIGSALLLSIDLPANFKMPYAASNIADFWRRWHITLSDWLRDYLYFSLPGLRSKIMLFTYANLTLTMVLGGLWHGASWNFVIWGLLHGLGLAFVRAMQVRRGRAPYILPSWLRALVTFHFVCLAWIFFRAGTLDGALMVIDRIASLTASTANITAPFAIVLSLAAAGHFVPGDWMDKMRNLYVRAPFYAQAAVLLLLAISIQYIAATGAAPFIYTRF
jgi:alginate O-acetyltransferase complex protein AlgI